MKYFSANGVLGRGAIFNQVYSDRSDGKTFDIKYRGICRYLKHRYTTVYVRRWKTEFSKAMVETFLDEVLNIHKELDTFEWRGSKNGIEVKEGKEWHYMFYFVPISVSNKVKSNFDVTNIREIDFDEYVPLDNKYAPEEMINLIELYRTCDRDRNLVKLCTFGNRVTSVTPFLNFFNISPDLTVPRIRTYKDGTIAIQVYMNEEHRERVNTSPLAKALDNTMYDAYMKGGILEGLSFVTRQKPSDAHVWAAFKTVNGEGSIWHDMDGIMYISDRQVPCNITVTDQVYGLVGYARHELVATQTNTQTRFKLQYREAKLYYMNERAFYLFKPIADLIGLK